jgi:hypothetical protein
VAFVHSRGAARDVDVVSPGDRASPETERDKSGPYKPQMRLPLSSPGCGYLVRATFTR